MAALAPLPVRTGRAIDAAPVVRRRVRVRGTVQGVGFRPFVYRLATELALDGSVLNDADGVLVDVQGPADVVGEFVARLETDAPALARVASVDAVAQPPRDDAGGFRIVASTASVAARVRTAVVPDTATCNDCLRELFDPADRRHRYAFVNCTQCGPRYTITRALPYDRAQTSMAAFAQCPACLAEYTDPAHRRFHAEPNACPVCGPRLTLVDAAADGSAAAAVAGTDTADDADVDPVAGLLARLRRGAIVAVKGLGGFHLMCEATDAAAVARLRARKARDEKPFAVLVASVASARRWADVDANDAALLASPERPIVLLPRRADADDALAGVAPGLDTLGVMLPSTPLQFLLFHEAAGRPAGTAWLDDAQPLVVVATSANPGGEPLVRDNDEALARLHGIADAWLLHDRDIVARCDDSVRRGTGTAGGTAVAPFIRRARGYTPRAIALPGLDRDAPSVLATGAWLKNTVCVTRGDEAWLSPHIGSLDNAATCAALDEAVDHLCTVLDVQPQAVAHDLHPDFYSTRYALAWAAERGVPSFAVQHHHAHVAAVAAEHGARGALLGLALDGVGLGSDGRAWGGDLLLVDGVRFERLAHVAPIAMPGGDVAAREPWRMAAAVLHALGRSGEIVRRFGHQRAAEGVAQMLDRGLRCPPTTSVGRWFDAAAALLGVRDIAAYEGQAPMLLEALAARGDAAFADTQLAPLAPIAASDELYLHPLLDALADEGDAARGAALFHAALADGLARWVAGAAMRTGIRRVALGGGCFLNARLTRALLPKLRTAGVDALLPRAAPPNDGAIALGQAWVAAQRLAAAPAAA